MNFTPVWEDFQQKARAGMNGAGADHDEASSVEPFPAKVLKLRDPKTIPPREWVYGNILVRKVASLVSATGGTGKTSWTIGVAASVALNQPFLGDKVYVQGNVLICSLEDPEVELERRISAFALHHKIEFADLDGKLIVVDGRTNRLTIAKIGEDRNTIVYPHKDGLIALIKAHEIALTIVDPFVNSHELTENSNEHMNAAGRTWAEIANETNSSILLSHHIKKGGTPGDADSSRGGSALNDACRRHVSLSPMPEDAATNYGIPTLRRKLYVRLDTAKDNLSPPDEHTSWFRLASVSLGNATETYPDGDNIQAIERWTPPDVMEGLTIEQCNEALDAIEAGHSSGKMFTMNGTAASTEKWCGRPLMELFGLERETAAKIIKTWKQNGVLVEEKFKNSESKVRAGARVVAAKRPGTRTA